MIYLQEYKYINLQYQLETPKYDVQLKMNPPNTNKPSPNCSMSKLSSKYLKLQKLNRMYLGLNMKKVDGKDDRSLNHL
jgi:hypothetical protein